MEHPRAKLVLVLGIIGAAGNVVGAAALFFFDQAAVFFQSM